MKNSENFTKMKKIVNIVFYSKKKKKLYLN